jgi:hypothetical protein
MLSREDQVTSLALATRLKALGVPQESLYVWSVPVPERAKDAVERKAVERVGRGLYEATAVWTEAFDLYAAFTSAELGALLPAVIEIGGKSRRLRIAKADGGSTSSVWRVQYEAEGQEVDPSCEAEREADARAQVLISLLEQHLLALP